VLLLDGFIQQGVVNFHVILDLGFIFKMLGCAISDSLYIGFGEMISILNAKWAYDVSG